MVPIGVTDGQKGEGTKGGVVAIGVRDSQPASQTDRQKVEGERWYQSDRETDRNTERWGRDGSNDSEI